MIQYGESQHATRPAVDAAQLYGAPRHDTSEPTPERRCYDERADWEADAVPEAAPGSSPVTAD